MVDEVEFLYTQDRMNVIRDLRKEPECVEYIERTNLRGVMFPSVPNPIFNRIMLSGPVRLDDLREVLELYQVKGAPADLEISPGAINEEVAKFLHGIGYTQTKFLPVFLKPVRELSAQRSDGLIVKQVSTPEELAQFQELYVTGWKINAGFAPVLKTFIAGWHKFSDWQLSVAYLDKQAIGCAVLDVKNSMAYLADAATPKEFRGKGAQTALLLARFKNAMELGADLLFTRADFGSTSQRNMEKQDLRTSYTRAFWVKV